MYLHWPGADSIRSRPAARHVSANAGRGQL